MPHDDLRDGLTAALTPVFGRLPAFVSDDPSIVRWLRTIGCAASTFEEAAGEPDVVVLAASHRGVPAYERFDALFHDSRVLTVPLAAFDPSLASAVYATKLLARSPFEAAAAGNAEWLRVLTEGLAPLELVGGGCRLTCEIDDDVCVMRPKTEAALLPGEWENVGAYFEVGMVTQPDDLRPAFGVDGTLLVAGVAIAHHRQMPDVLLPHVARAWALFQEVRRQGLFPLEVTVERSRIVAIRAGTRDLAPELEVLTNERRELVLTEMAFSTNAGVDPAGIDWTINSQLNEGALGIHVAAGDGITGAHVDLICPGVSPG